jgi:hypothetical protein
MENQKSKSPSSDKESENYKIGHPDFSWSAGPAGCL